MALFGLDFTSLEKYLNSYGGYIVRQAKSILKRRNDTGGLTNSLKYKVQNTVKGITLEFLSAEHGKYIAKGVSGTRSRRSYIDEKGNRKPSPFKYRSTSNLKGLENATGTFRNYAKRKGLKGRGKDGRFITDKSLGFAIAESVKKKGIRAASYYTKPLSMSFKKFQKELEKNFGKDISKNIQKIL
ncbi:MAG: hypothetical protein Unbinned4264contig1000_28 [Prokaryotic dsDNA virus sp.]|nr:MAG: hypothetical protein Unbinned4264contig1000_28 [Prokaryotic dsDNA virus sp.]|tara:strand:+ start:162 stop:716 length:555 start_codon:yes stop_codon:yes gene_type:complete